MQTLVRDVRYAIRSLKRNRGFAIVALLTLALGIGANTVIFSIVNAVLIRPLPYPDADRLVMVFETTPGENSLEEAVSPANYLDWKSENSVFERMAAYRESNFNITGGDKPERVEGAIASEELFPLLGVKPQLGQIFREGDRASNVGNVLISHAFWALHFGSDPNVVGQKLVVDGRPLSVIGVMPRGFSFPAGVELWTTPTFAVPEHPLRPGVDPSSVRGSHYLDVVARLRSGITLQQGRVEMDTVGRRLASTYPSTNQNNGVNLVQLREEAVGNVRPMLLLLFGAVGFVLLIACANVANLVMARTAGRRKEIAIREALGASRGRIACQLLTESVVLSAAGGTAGLLVALWGMGPLVSLLPPGLHGATDIRIDRGVLEFTVLLSLMTGVLFGLLPAYQAGREDVNASLKEGGRSSAGASNRTRGALVIAEISLALVLLVGAGLLIKSFIRLQSVDPGFSTSNLMSMRVNLPNAKYRVASEQSRFFHQVLERVRARGEVEAAGAVSRLPLTPGNSSRSLTLEGRAPTENPEADYRVISGGYFHTMGIPLQRGRDFSDHDDAAAPGVAIINLLAARQIWPGEDPIGKRFQLDDPEWFEVVGIVGDIRHFGLDTESKPEIYLPYLKKPWPFMSIVARGRNGEAGLAGVMREAVWAVDKDQPVSSLDTIENLLSRSLTGRRFNLLLLGAFAGIAITLAAIGTYGVIAYSVAQRRQEIGIRMALGASRANVIKMVVVRGLSLAVAGVSIGLASSFALTRFMDSMLYEVTATDPLVFFGVSILLILVAALASYVPAITATRVDPMIALRAE
jgi:predicted permease